LCVTTATAAHGTVDVNSDGTISYTPDGDYNGKDTITVTVSVAAKVILVAPSSPTDFVLSTVRVGASLTSLTVMEEVLIVVAPSSLVAMTMMVSAPL
jgi:hypothetical protein